jgi:hypothetical protein
MTISILLFLTVFSFSGCAAPAEASLKALSTLATMHPAAQVTGILSLAILLVSLVSAFTIGLTGKRPW